MRDQVPVRAGLVVEVEVFKSLIAGEPGRFDPQCRTRRFTFGDLKGEDRGQVFLVRPPSIAGLVTQSPKRITNPRCTQRAGEILNLRCRTITHATTSRSLRSRPVSTAKSVS